MYIDGLYTLFSSCRNLNELSIKCQSYPKSTRVDAFKQNIYKSYKKIRN